MLLAALINAPAVAGADDAAVPEANEIMRRVKRALDPNRAGTREFRVLLSSALSDAATQWPLQRLDWLLARTLELWQRARDSSDELG